MELYIYVTGVVYNGIIGTVHLIIKDKGASKMSISLNLVVIHSSNIQKSVTFYQNLGLAFNKERHGSGPDHYASELGNLVFEIYPTQSKVINVATRIGFNVDDIDEIVDRYRIRGGTIITELTDSHWGKRAVIEDPDGYKIELLEPIKK